VIEKTQNVNLNDFLSHYHSGDFEKINIIDNTLMQ